MSENSWEKHALDFEAKNLYVVKQENFEIVQNEVLNLKNLGNVIELGCGNATYTKMIAKNAKNVLATDISDEMLSVAKQNCKDYKNISFLKLDCFDISLTSKFDCIFMANLFHIIPNQNLMLEQIKKVCKNNTKLIILSFTMQGLSLFDKMSLTYRYLKTYGMRNKNSKSLKLKDFLSILEPFCTIIDTKIIGKSTKALLIIANVKIQ